MMSQYNGALKSIYVAGLHPPVESPHDFKTSKPGWRKFPFQCEAELFVFYGHQTDLNRNDRFKECATNVV